VSMRDTIVALFQRIASEQKKKLAPLVDDLVLVDSGLDSLAFALIVTRLEDELECDPFSVAEEVDFPVTFGDFVRLYEKYRAV